MQTKVCHFLLLFIFLFAVTIFSFSSDKSVLLLPSRVVVEHRELCFSDIGFFAKSWNLYDKSRWKETCFLKSQKYSPIKTYHLSLDDIELFLLENNFFFDEIFFSDSKNNVMLIEFTLDKNNVFYTEVDFKTFIQKKIPKLPLYEINFLDKFSQAIPRKASLSIYPLDPSKTEKFLQVVWPFEKGFVQEIVRLRFQLIYKEINPFKI